MIDNSQEFAGLTKGYNCILYHVYVMYSCILYSVYYILRTVYSILYTYCVHIGLHTFSTYARMALPRLEKHKHVRLHALQGQGDMPPSDVAELRRHASNLSTL